MVGLERPFLGDPQILGLFGRHLGQFDAKLVQVETGDHFVEVLRQHVNRVLGVSVGAFVQFHLGQHLVGERGAHDEGWVSGGAAQVQQSTFGQHNDGVALGQFEFMNLGFDLDLFHPRVGFEIGHLDLVVEVANVAHDGIVLHGLHVLERDDVFVACGGHENVGISDRFVHGDHFVAFHGGLESANRVNLGDFDPAALSPKRLGAALANVSIAEDDGHFA